MKNIKGKSGFSLIEVMVSMLVLTILILGGSATFGSAGGIVRHHSARRVAVLAGIQIMEFYLFDPSQGIDALESAASSNGGTNQYSEVIAESGVNYTVTTDVNNLTDAGKNYVQVRTTVAGGLVDPFSLTYRARTTL